MLASSNNPTSEKKSFIAVDHFKELCVGGKITLHESIQIDYPGGWARIVADFVQEVRDLRVTIYSVESREQMLRVEFHPKSQQSALRTFRATHDAMIRSRSACFECGKQVAYVDNNGRFDLCTQCRLVAAKKGKTGTWLDKFV